MIRVARAINPTYDNVLAAVSTITAACLEGTAKASGALTAVGKGGDNDDSCLLMQLCPFVCLSPCCIATPIIPLDHHDIDHDHYHGHDRYEHYHDIEDHYRHDHHSHHDNAHDNCDYHDHESMMSSDHVVVFTIRVDDVGASL